MSDDQCCGKSCACNEGLNRRDFMKTAAATTAAGVLTSRTASAIAPDELAKWNAQLFEKGQRRIHRGAQLEHIAFPLGGFGAGQVYLKGDGRLGPWQILNNFNLHAELPGGHFGVWTRDQTGNKQARILQEGQHENADGVTAIEFSSEYPYAWLDYLDASLPVDIRLEAHSPFIPLNAKDSALPAALFKFTVRNKTDQSIDAAIMATAPNLIGWDGYTRFDGVTFKDFSGNYNEFEQHTNRAQLNMTAQTGEGHRLHEPVRGYFNDPDIAHHLRYCENLDLHFDRNVALGEADAKCVYWIGDLHADTPADRILQAFDRAREGASLVISGGQNSLLAWIDAARNAERGDYETFEDWESGDYAGWKTEGEAFGPEPARGTLPNQSRVSGHRGARLVNTFFEGDDTTGKATSKPFVIKRGYIHLLVGGGNRGEQTQVRLVIDGKPVAVATGDDAERLRNVTWDVQAYKGQKATIEIVDDAMGGWGHILVDDIVFSDAPQMPTLNNEQLAALEDALPFAYESLTQADNGVLQINGLETKPGATIMDGQPGQIIRGNIGKGRIYVIAGDPTQWAEGYNRKNLMGALVAGAVDVQYDSITAINPTWPSYGSMNLATLGDTAKHAEAFPHWDDFNALWNDFAQNGSFKRESQKTASGFDRTWNAALSVPVQLGPHEEKEVTFALAWHFPNRIRNDHYGWGPGQYRQDAYLGNQYNNWFKNASDVVAYIADNYKRLDAESRKFHRAFYDSSLPWYFLDAVAANFAIIRSPIYIWLENGFVGGFEGADNCCPMNCTHVYNYVMATAFLFPELERNVRETDLLIQMHPTEHYIPHRTKLPLEAERLGFEIGGPHHPALDGEFGTLLKTYREFRLCGDKQWLAKLWPNAKTHMQYLIKTHVDDTGIIRGEQPNTYDVHTYGANTFLGTLYLAALRSMEEMARVMDDSAFAEECRQHFEKGRDTYDRVCWDGEYYMNVYDAPGAEPDTYNRMNCWGPGCHADQLLGQFWADLLDLGYMLPAERTRQAIAAVHRHCWLPDLSSFEHNQRVFAEGNEKGMLNCAWPKGGRPERPVLYCDEVWTGIEYHVASTLIREGLVAEGLQIVLGARERYTGDNRNPFAELECGYHYSRALSCYGLLMAAGGMAVDAHNQTITIAPRMNEKNYKSFFSTGTGWGVAQAIETNQQKQRRFKLEYGQVTLKEIRTNDQTNWTATLNGKTIPTTTEPNGSLTHIRLTNPITLMPNDELILTT